MKKVIVITGGSEGLGKETAKLLSKNHTVVALSSTKEKLEKTAVKLNCDYEVCDLSKWKDVEKATSNIIKRHKRIDVLINNAGIWIQDDLEKNDPDLIRRVVEVNTLGVIFMTKSVIPQMKKQKVGLIINIISQAGIYWKAERSVYNASKWAITGFTKCLQAEVSKYNIGVTGFYPGFIKTDLFKKNYPHIKRDYSYALNPQDVAKTIVYVVSLKSPITIPEIGIKNIYY